MKIGITLGDPKGIGPEVVHKALNLLKGKLQCDFVLFGDESHRHSEAQAGRAAGEAIQTATRAALAHEIDAIVTAPIHKGRFNQAGYNFPGHTEFLGALTKTARPVMMFVARDLKVSLVTIHEPLASISKLLNSETIEHTVCATDTALKQWFGISQPRIAVAAFNPHGSEAGLFGNEETTIIAPTVARLQKKFPGVSGPHPADTLFYRAHGGEFDAVVAMYHDQGLIPIKLLDFHGAVNVTLGLPIIRTSPDHGTADAIAGKGVANPSSMVAAITLAHEMSLRGRDPSLRSGQAPQSSCSREIASLRSQ